MKRLTLLFPFAFHLFALLVVFRLAHWHLWAAPILFGALLFLRRVRAEALMPLFALYSFALLRLIFVYGLHQTPPPALDYGWALVLCGLGALLMIQRGRWAWLVLAASAAALTGYLLWLNRPAGVTGSDPLAYVWMAVDFAERGTFRHSFPLATLAASLGLSPLPAQHVGYILPDTHGLAPTVWPPGFSVLLAFAYRLAGHAGMMSLNMLLAVLNLAVTFALAATLTPRRWRVVPLAVGAGAALILATSLEQYVRLGVPLADGAAQLFTTLALLFSLLASHLSPRTSHLSLLGFLAGLTLAAAYSVRYTQALIAPGLVVIAWIHLSPSPSRALGGSERGAGGEVRVWRFLIPFALTALLGALPDVIYRTALYGSPLRFGTGELALFAWQTVPQTLRQFGAELFSGNEFGWLWPLALIGAIYLWRRNRQMLIGLAAVYLPLLTFHLFYPFLKLRDVLALYAPLAALCALGGAVVGVALWRRGAIARAVVIIVLVALFLPRLQTVWGLTHGFFTFGYLYPEQQRALASIDSLTEPNAVIACSLNSGAVELYGHRPAVRPGNQLQPNAAWSEADWLKFVDALRAEGRPVYVLMDSPEMEAPLEAVKRRWAVTPIADLPVPVFFIGGGALNRTVPLYRVDGDW